MSAIDGASGARPRGIEDVGAIDDAQAADAPTTGHDHAAAAAGRPNIAGSTEWAASGMRAMIEGAYADLETAETGSTQAPKAGNYELPFGGTLNVTSSGEVLYEPPADMPTDGLELQGFEWAGETGALSLPADDKREHRATGAYNLPGDNGTLHVLDGGEALWEPPDSADLGALEQADFTWAGETGYMYLPGGSASVDGKEGTHQLPGGGAFVVSGDSLMYEPGDAMTEGLERQGFAWAGETGALGLPKTSGPGMNRPGEYMIGGGARLHVLNTGEVLLEPPNYDTEAQLKELGFAWAGETGYMSLPR
jgi:hypothetical protein